MSTKSVLFPEDEDPTLVKSWAVIRESDGELVETKDFTEEEARKYSVEHPDMYLVLSLSVR